MYKYTGHNSLTPDLARCIKLTIDGNFAINGNYHGNRAQQPIKIKIKVSMVVTIDGKVTINGKFCATGLGRNTINWCTNLHTATP